MSSPLKRIDLRIHGMHCASCEFTIEEKFRAIPGVEKVAVSQSKGRAKLFCSAEPTLAQLQSAIAPDGYTVSPLHQESAAATKGAPTASAEHWKTGALFLLVTGLYIILRQFDILPSFAVSNNMSYGVVFLIGLVAAASTCIAVTGGLLLGVAAKFNEAHPELNGRQKLVPHLYFNAGRIVSYTIFGAVIGALGSLFSLSARVTGIITIGASIVMIVLGFQMLKLFPWMSRLIPRMPRFLARRVATTESRGSRMSTFALGGGTFFLPCGFTQALQLYVLSRGDSAAGALTMFFFSLGTLPALLSLSAISSFAKGAFQKYFIKTAGVVVVLLGIFNVQSGFALTGVNVNFASIFKSDASSLSGNPNVRLENGKQVVEMKVRGLQYSPANFTVVKGVPVEWRIDGSAARGCGQAISIPALRKIEFLDPGQTNVIAFTPTKTGFIGFSCTMGMTTPGAGFTVVENNAAPSAAKPLPTNEKAPACDPNFAQCVSKDA